MKLRLRFRLRISQLSTVLLLLGFFCAFGNLVGAQPPAGSKSPSKPAEKAAESKASEKSAEKPKPEVVLENVVPVSADDLVSRPHDYVGKNVKFSGNFSNFVNLALDFKPAFRSSKTHLSFLILRPKTQIPLSELKIAMMIPKEKDPETLLLTQLKSGDQVELVGKVFSAALDDPWVEVFKIKKLGGSSDDKKAQDDKKADASADKTKSTEAKSTSENKNEKVNTDKN